ncbi:MAG: hypothetical protein GXP14_05085, partial [Gammaproteobacteria bacterium]|nr:hypothetical protein [Gammaproteobacteria bacterium]
MKRERLSYTGYIFIVVSMLLTACGGGGGNSTSPDSIVSVSNDKVGSPVVEDSTPTVSSASIIDNNAGRPVVGDELTGSYNFSDVNGNIDGTFIFRWLRHGIPISGAIESTYTLVVADSGQPIIFEVTLVVTAGTGSAVAASGVTVANSAPTASAVNISGSAVVGVTLTGSYTYNDLDGDAQGTSTFRWLRNGSPIGGATALTYTLVAADSGQTIVFEVTPVATMGTTTGNAVASSGLTISNSAPTASGVNVSGSAVVGATLTGSYIYNDVNGDTQGASTFRWLRNGSPIGGATVLTYTLVMADSGQSVSFEVTPVAVAGILTGSAVTSGGLTITNSAPTANSVTITDDNGGGAYLGDTLTGNYIYSDVDGDAENTSTFRWLRNSTPIGSATALTYNLVAADSGRSISFEVTPVAAAGILTGSAVTSSGLTIFNSPPTAGSVTITDDNGGSAEVGDILTGAYVYSDVDGDTEGISTFRWLRNGSPIGGATALTYILVIADSGQTIVLEVTPVSATGTRIGSVVASSGLTISNSAPTASGVNLSGSAVVGATLTGSYTYNDLDGDTQGASTFRWLLNGSPIGGATALTYTLVAADSGQTIVFEVTPIAITGTMTGNAVASSGLLILNSPPTANSVTITDVNGGSAVVGDNLTGNYSYTDVDGDTEGTS